MGTYLKDSIELLNRPASAIHGSAGTSSSMTRDNFTTHEIAKVCLQLFEVANPADYDVRRLAEELEKENGIRGYADSNPSPLHRGTSARYAVPRKFTAVIPKKALDRLSTKYVLEFFKNTSSNSPKVNNNRVFPAGESLWPPMRFPPWPTLLPSMAA